MEKKPRLKSPLPYTGNSITASQNIGPVSTHPVPLHRSNHSDLVCRFHNAWLCAINATHWDSVAQWFLTEVKSRGAPDPQFSDPAGSGSKPDLDILDPAGSGSKPDLYILVPAGSGSNNSESDWIRIRTPGSRHHIEFSHRRGFPIMRILWCPTSSTIGLQYTTINITT